MDMNGHECPGGMVLLTWRVWGHFGWGAQPSGVEGHGKEERYFGRAAGKPRGPRPSGARFPGCLCCNLRDRGLAARWRSSL